MDDLRRSAARLSTHPDDDGPWAPFAIMLSADPDLWPLTCNVTTVYPDPHDTDVIDAAPKADPVDLEVAFGNFTWEGPAGISAEDRWSLEVWVPIADDFPGAAPGAENWTVLWVPAVRLKLPHTIGPGAAPPEIAFTTEGVQRATSAAPPLSAVPPDHRGKPIGYLFTQYLTTDRPPAERNATGD